MTLLHPALAGLAAMAAVPILIHLLNRRRYRKIEWAAMEFLLRAFQKTRRRVKLEEMLLLALRCAAMILFALAVARPVVSEGLAAALGVERLHRIVCLDASYSMAAREGAHSRWDLAREAARELIQEMAGRGEVTVLRYSDIVEPVAVRESGDAGIARALSALHGTDCAVTDMPGAPVALFRALAQKHLWESDIPRKEIVILTDLQRRGWDDEAAWRGAAEAVRAVADAAHVIVVDVSREPVSNLGISDFSVSSRFVAPGRPVRLTVTVRNHGEAHPGEIPIELYEGTGPGRVRRWNGTIPGLDAGQERAATIFYTFRGGGVYPLTVEIGGDRLAPDDARSLSVWVRDRVRVMVVDGSPGGDDPTRGTGLLEWALTLGGGSPIDVDRVPLWRFRNEDVHDLGRYAAVVLADVRAIPRGTPDHPGQLERLAAYVRNGGGLVVFPGDEADVPFYNRELYADGEGLLPCPLGEVREAPRDAFFSFAVEPSHPLGVWFSDYEFHLRRASFVRRYREMQPPPEGGAARTVLSWAGSEGGIALAERTWGLGRVFCFGIPCDRSWGDFPASPVFLAVAHDLVYLLSESGARRNGMAGEPIRELLPAHLMTLPMAVVGPEPEFAVQRVLPESEENRAVVWFGHGGTPEARRLVARAGVYALEVGRPVQERIFFARNVDPAEGDLSRADPALLERVLAPAHVEVRSEGAAARGTSGGTGGGKEWWTTALVVLLGVMGLESLLARWFSSRS